MRGRCNSVESVNWQVALSAMRRGLAGHLTKDIRSLTRRQIVAEEADRIAATGKRGRCR